MAVLAQQSTSRALWEDVLVQQSTIGELERFCWNIRVLYEHSGGFAGTVLVQQSTIGAISGL